MDEQNARVEELFSHEEVPTNNNGEPHQTCDNNASDFTPRAASSPECVQTKARNNEEEDMDSEIHKRFEIGPK